MFKKGDKVRLDKMPDNYGTWTVGKIYEVGANVRYPDAIVDDTNRAYTSQAGPINFYTLFTLVQPASTVSSPNSINEPLKVGDKIRFLIDKPSWASVPADGLITLSHVSTETNVAFYLGDNIIHYLYLDGEGTIFERILTDSNTVLNTSQTAPISPTVRHKCRCEFRDLLMNGCRCGGF